MNATELELVARLLLAAAIGFAIGLERELAGMPAGDRTHALVALGACAFAIVSVRAFPGADGSRIAAGVVTGLGFLGAGMILHDRSARVRGLTTAAGVWALGAVGLAIGAGLYWFGLACALIVAAILASERFLRIGERLAHRRARIPGGDAEE